MILSFQHLYLIIDYLNKTDQITNTIKIYIFDLCPSLGVGINFTIYSEHNSYPKS